jgi:ankyrin repeat protein
MAAQDPGLAGHLPESARADIARAARNNDAEAVRLMLAAGLPVAARGQHRGTPVHWAAYHGNLAMVEAILPYKPPLEDAENDFQSSPLGWATHGSLHGWYCRTGDYPGVVQALLAAGAKPFETARGTEAVKEVQRKYEAKGYTR